MVSENYCLPELLATGDPTASRPNGLQRGRTLALAKQHHCLQLNLSAVAWLLDYGSYATVQSFTSRVSCRGKFRPVHLLVMGRDKCRTSSHAEDLLGLARW